MNRAKSCKDILLKIQRSNRKENERQLRKVNSVNNLFIYIW